MGSGADSVHEDRQRGGKSGEDAWGRPLAIQVGNLKDRPIDQARCWKLTRRQMLIFGFLLRVGVENPVRRYLVQLPGLTDTGFYPCMFA